MPRRTRRMTKHAETGGSHPDDRASSPESESPPKKTVVHPGKRHPKAWNEPYSMTYVAPKSLKSLHKVVLPASQTIASPQVHPVVLHGLSHESCDTEIWSDLQQRLGNTLLARMYEMAIVRSWSDKFLYLHCYTAEDVERLKQQWKEKLNQNMNEGTEKEGKETGTGSILAHFEEDWENATDVEMIMFEMQTRVPFGVRFEMFRCRVLSHAGFRKWISETESSPIRRLPMNEFMKILKWVESDEQKYGPLEEFILFHGAASLTLEYDYETESCHVVVRT